MRKVQQWVNNQRRAKLSEAQSLLNRANSIIEYAKDDEQDSFDNLPEGFQCSWRGESMENSIDELQLAIDSINDAISHIDCARNG